MCKLIMEQSFARLLDTPKLLITIIFIITKRQEFIELKVAPKS